MQSHTPHPARQEECSPVEVMCTQWNPCSQVRNGTPLLAFLIFIALLAFHSTQQGSGSSLKEKKCLTLSFVSSWNQLISELPTVSCCSVCFEREDSSHSLTQKMNASDTSWCWCPGRASVLKSFLQCSLNGIPWKCPTDTLPHQQALPHNKQNNEKAKRSNVINSLNIQG